MMDWKETLEFPPEVHISELDAATAQLEGSRAAPYNAHELAKLVRNGPEVWPGARYVVHADGRRVAVLLAESKVHVGAVLHCGSTACVVPVSVNDPCPAPLPTQACLGALASRLNAPSCACLGARAGSGREGASALARMWEGLARGSSRPCLRARAGCFFVSGPVAHVRRVGQAARAACATSSSSS